MVEWFRQPKTVFAQLVKKRPLLLRRLVAEVMLRVPSVCSLVKTRIDRDPRVEDMDTSLQSSESWKNLIYKSVCGEIHPSFLLRSIMVLI